MFATRSAWFAVLALCCLLTSAAPSVANANGGVNGSITLDGKPLAAGKIAFHRENGQFVGSKVKDGKFAIDRVPAGTFRVTLEGKGIPRAYTSEDTSALVVQVVEDNPNRFDFDLKTSKPN